MWWLWGDKKWHEKLANQRQWSQNSLHYIHIEEISNICSGHTEVKFVICRYLFSRLPSEPYPHCTRMVQRGLYYSPGRRWLTLGMRLMMSGYFPVLSSWFLLKIFTSPPSRTCIYHHRRRKRKPNKSFLYDTVFRSHLHCHLQVGKFKELLHRSEQITSNFLIPVTCV